MCARHGLYGDGLAAHVLYRAQGQPVPPFIMPGLERPAAELSVLGLVEVVWTQGGRTHMLVAEAGTMAGLARLETHPETTLLDGEIRRDLHWRYGGPALARKPEE